MNNKRLTFADRQKIEALYNLKVPVKVIADTLGFSFQAIYYELKKRLLYAHKPRFNRNKKI